MGKRDWYKIGIFALGIIMITLGAVTTVFNIYNMNNVGFAVTDSQLGNLSADVQTYIACTWSSISLDVDFGSMLNPGDNDYNATANNLTNPGTGYNVTVSPLTTSNVNVSILGNDLIDGGNTIGVGNITWASNETNSNGANLIPGSSTPMTGSSVDIASNVAAGSPVYYRFWMDVPDSTVAGQYVGNYTIACQQS